MTLINDEYWLLIPSEVKTRILESFPSCPAVPGPDCDREGQQFTPLFSQKTKHKILSAEQSPLITHNKKKDGSDTPRLVAVSTTVGDMDRSFHQSVNNRLLDIQLSSDIRNSRGSFNEIAEKGLALLDPSTPVLTNRDRVSQVSRDAQNSLKSPFIQKEPQAVDTREKSVIPVLEQLWKPELMQSPKALLLLPHVASPVSSQRVRDSDSADVDSKVKDVIKSRSSSSGSHSSLVSKGSSNSSEKRVKSVDEMIANMKLKAVQNTLDVTDEQLNDSTENSNNIISNVQVREEDTFDDDLTDFDGIEQDIHKFTQNFRLQATLKMSPKSSREEMTETAKIDEIDEDEVKEVTSSQIETETKAIQRLFDIDCFSLSMSQSQSNIDDDVVDKLKSQRDSGDPEKHDDDVVQKEHIHKDTANDYETGGDFIGFTKASGKKMIPLSDEALEKAKKLFDEPSNTQEHPETAFVGFTKANGQQMKPISDEALQKAQVLFNDAVAVLKPVIDEIIHSDVPMPPQFAGFTSAAGKKMKSPSKEAQEKAKMLFEDAKYVIDEHKAIEKLNEGFVGFASASGKQMKPLSKDAIEKAKSMFNDVDVSVDDNDSDMRNNAGAFNGFASASGKIMKPLSKEAIQKAKLMFDDVGESTVQNESEIPDSESFVGFKSATGKNMNTISEESLKRAQALFGDELGTDLIKPSGFASASGKKMKPLSEESLKNAETLFKDTSSANLSTEKFGFTSASGKNVKPLSKDALAKAKALLEQDPFEATKVTEPKASNLNQIAKTEFAKPIFAKPQTPVVTRTPRGRAGLPKPSGTTPSASIGHKRRFSTPFVKPSPIVKKTIEKMPESKKPKISSVSLFELTRQSDRLSYKEYVSAKSKLDFQITGLFQDQDLVSTMTLDKARELAENLALDYQKKLIGMGALEICATLEWISNHLAMIIHKFCCYLRNFSKCVFHDANDEGIFKQLAYRYEREVNQSQRSIVKKICERDDVSTHDMVLAVYIITRNPADGSLRVILGDGWYTIPSLFDRSLQKAVETGKINVGTKLHVFGCQLSGGQSACSPLESDESKPALTVSANCCRLVSWESKLGRTGKHFTRQTLNSISSEGGIVPCVDIIVLRQYPFSYLETKPAPPDLPNAHPTRVVLNSQEEYEVDQEYQKQRQREVDRLIDEHARQQAKSTTTDLKKFKLTIPKDISHINDPALLKKYLEQDPSISSKLTQIQIGILQDYITYSESGKMESIQRQVMEQVDDKYPPRNSRPFLRLKVADFQSNTKKAPIIAYITLWNPQPHAFQSFSEGKRVLIQNIVPSTYSTHDGHLQLSSGKFTSWKEFTISVRSTCGIVPFNPRDFSKLLVFTMRKVPDIGANAVKSNEDYYYDLVIMLIHVENYDHVTRLFVTDSTGKLAVISLKGDKYQLKMYTKSMLQEKSILFVNNVKWTGIDKNVNLILFDGTDETTLSLKSSHQHALQLKSEIQSNQEELYQKANDYIMNKILYKTVA